MPVKIPVIQYLTNSKQNITAKCATIYDISRCLGHGGNVLYQCLPSLEVEEDSGGARGSEQLLKGITAAIISQKHVNFTLA